MRRRRLLTTASALPFLPWLAPARAVAASERVTLGFIGVGGHGLSYNLKSFLELEGAQVVAVCDVFASRREAAKRTVDEKYGNTDCRAFADFRALLAAPDIDAVCISTPDHWHVPISTLAVEAGKDVMCEKPTLTIAEGRELANLVTARKRVFQVGLEDRSVIQYHKLAEWARNGAIGKLRRMEVGLPSGPVFPREQAAPVPEDLNYDLWLGPAPFHPYTPNRTGAMQWRSIRDYSGGIFTDWGSHIMDTAQVANFAENSGPVSVRGEGRIPNDSLGNMPVDFTLQYRYANGVEMEVKSGGVRLKLIGDDGWVGNTGWRGRLEASSEDLLRIKYEPGQSKLWPLPPGEHADFLEAVKTRRPATYTAEAGHRLSTAMHIGNIALQLGRPLRWDPDREEFPGDAEANALRRRASRDDWMKSG